MSELEYQILDELYFTLNFEKLLRLTGLAEEVLKVHLGEMIQKGWVKALIPNEEAELEDYLDFNKEYKNYNYLATKKGLFLHNSR